MNNLRQIGPNKYALVNKGGETTHLITKKANGQFERMSFGRFPRRTNHTSLAEAITGNNEVKRQVAEGCFVVA